MVFMFRVAWVFSLTRLEVEDEELNTKIGI